ncbi:helix-turn-helix domain-containing protein [Bacteroidota bacterium]
MKNIIENLPENINITVSKQDLLEFADYLLSKVVSNEREIKPYKSILNTEEVAEFIGTSKSTIYKYTHHGQIPHYKRGKRLYFKTEEIVEWLTENRGYNRREIEAKANEYLIRNPRK